VCDHDAVPALLIERHVAVPSGMVTLAQAVLIRLGGSDAWTKSPAPSWLCQIGRLSSGCGRMEQLPGLPDAAFDKADPSPDAEFYAFPRFVTHIDDAAIAAVTQVYRETLPPNGAVLDLMSSWVSHLPEDIEYASVVGHGMNAEELAANPRLSRWFVQDLNVDPALPLDDAAFDGACLCVSVQYLQRPVEVFREVRRVLRAGAPFVVTFSNRCFPTKAVAIWQAFAGPDQQRLVSAYMRAAGFAAVTGRASVPPQSDPLWVVIGEA
jgi:SAM-dependent methyltransferase